MLTSSPMSSNKLSFPHQDTGIFYPPSASWLSRAGVVVNYAPEDTMKSLIMVQKTRKQQALMQVNRDLTVATTKYFTEHEEDDNEPYSDFIDLTKNSDCEREANDESEETNQFLSTFFPPRRCPSPQQSNNAQRCDPVQTFVDHPRPSPCPQVDLDETEDLNLSASSASNSPVSPRLPFKTGTTSCVDETPCAGKSFDQLLADTLRKTSDPQDAVPNLVTTKPTTQLSASSTKNPPKQAPVRPVSRKPVASETFGTSSAAGKQTSRPFLRKNQGRAAWAHKIQGASELPSPKVRLTVETYSDILKTLPRAAVSLPITIRPSENPDQDNIPDNAILVPSSRKDKVNNMRQTSVPTTTSAEETDLEEFELLEKATENSFTGSVSSLVRMDKHQLKRRLNQQTKPISPPTKSVWFQDVQEDEEEEEPQKNETVHRRTDYLDGLNRTSATLSVSPSTPELDNLTAEIFPKMPQLPKSQTNPLENTSVQASQLRHWVKVLEDEIKRFNNENAALAKLKQEKEEGLKRLQKEVKEFEEFKAKELRTIQEMRDTEMNKIKKEKKVFEDYQKAMRIAPDRKEREEIERLKAQLQELRDEIAQKESRWHTNHTCLRRRLEEVESEKGQLQAQVHNLEQKRLELQSRVAVLSSKTTATESSVDSVRPSNVTRVSQAVQFKKAPLIGVVPPPQQPPVHSVSKPNLYLGGKLRDSAASGYYTGEDDTATTTTATTTNTGLSSARSAGDVPMTQSVITNSNLGRSQSASQFVVNRTAAACSSSSSTTTQPRDVVNTAVRSETSHSDGTVERHLPDGSRHILFPNGSVKKISADGKLVVVELFNGDVKKNLPDGTEVYYFSQQKVTHSKFPDGTEEFVYLDGRKEILRPTGQREYYSPNSAEAGVRVVWPNGEEQIVHPNGLIMWTRVNGEKEIHFPNGQREIHAQGSRRRIYPDGTVKTVYEDGSQETCYASGRIRKKDAEGRLLLDTKSRNAAHT